MIEINLLPDSIFTVSSLFNLIHIFDEHLINSLGVTKLFD